MAALPFPDDQFGAVLCQMALMFFPDRTAAIREMARVARPGGRVAVLEFSRPRHWLFGRAYRAYFRYLLPLVGQLFSRSRDRAYAYLPASVMQFPDGEALAERLRAAGLGGVTFSPVTLGIATLYVGTKPGPFV